MLVCIFLNTSVLRALISENKRCHLGHDLVLWECTFISSKIEGGRAAERCRVLESTVSLQHLSVTPILNADHLIKNNREIELVGWGNRRGGKGGGSPIMLQLSHIRENHSITLNNEKTLTRPFHRTFCHILHYFLF